MNNSGGKLPTTPVTVRLDENLILQLQGLCTIDGIKLAQEVRNATECYIDSRRNDPALALRR